MNRKALRALALCCGIAALPARADIVQGFVRNESGTGVPGVSVKFTGNSVGARPGILTDAGGFYSADMPSDTYRASFIPTVESRLVADRLFDIVVVGNTALPDVTLQSGALVSGLVTDGGGAPVASVDLTFEDPATGENVFTPNDNTDATGRYAIVVPVGAYDVEFTPPDFPALVPRLIEGVDVPGDVELPTVVLNAGVVVNGTVRDELSVPVEDVRLDFYDMASGEKVFTTNDSTNEFGVFRVVVDPAIFEIRFLPPGSGRLLPARLFDVSLMSDTTLADVVLAEGFELTGRVVDTGGGAIEAADLDVFEAGTSDRLLTPGDDTGPDGRYRLVVPAGTFDLRYNPPPGSSFLRVLIDGVEITGDLERPDVVLTDGFLVTGRLLDGSGTPVADVDLDFIDTTTGQALILPGDDSDGDGRFSISVPPGTYQIGFAPPQASSFLPFFLENETIDADRDLGELVLDAGFGVSGTVVDGTQSGVAGVDVDVLEGAQSVYLEYDETDGAGVFRVVVRGGSYRVRLDPGAASPFFPLLTDEIVVTSEIDLGMVELSTGVTVDGLVQDQFGAPVAGVTVTLTEDSPLPLVGQATTDAGGGFTLLVAPGTYDVQYLPPSVAYSSLDAGPFALDTDTTLPTAVLTRSPLLTGRAVDGSGTGVPDVDVDVLEEPAGTSLPLQNDLTDAAGDFAVAVPAGTYRLRLEPPAESGLFPFTSMPIVVPDDTDVGDLVLPQGALVSGIVTDSTGTPVRNVEVGVTVEPPDGLPKSHLAVTDRGGQYSFLVVPGAYTIWYDPPADSQLFPAEVGPLTIDASVELPPTVLETGWLVSGRVVDGPGTGLAGVDIDILDVVSGDSIPLNDDTTAGDGTFAVFVRGGSYRVRVEPDPLTRFLPLVTAALTVGPNADVGDLTLAIGFLVEADVFGDAAQPLAGVDLDLVDVATGLDALLVDERTDATGHLVTAAAAGEYFAEYRPPQRTRWIPLRTGPHTIAGDTLLPAVQLTSGFLVSGIVVDAFAAPVAEVETRWVLAGTCDVVFTVRNSTDAAGRFEVALPAGGYDVILEPPPGSGLVGRRVSNVTVIDQDVVLPTETLGFDGPPLEPCNGIDDDCDGTADEDYPELGGECSAGLGACRVTGMTVCSGDGGAAVCDAVPLPPEPETCDGVDNDCDGIVDNGCTEIAFDVTLDGDTVSWPALVDAVSYDVVRGELVALRLAGLGTAAETCLAEDTADTSIVDGTVPPAGDGLWYLVRGETVSGAGSWGSAERDQAIVACSP